MSLVVAVPFGVAAAVAYGAATAVQHSAAHTGTGEVDARGLVRLARDPRWLLSVGGDGLGLLLQVVALSTGPVVLIQPLLVLAIPVSLPIGYLLGGPRPRASDLLACLAIIASLAVFLLLLGRPGGARAATPRAIIATVVAALVVGALLCSAVRGRGAGLRAGVYGGVAGAWFGMVGVLLNAAAHLAHRAGLGALLTHVAGLATVLGAVVLGVLGMVLTQLAFQVGTLAASFAANESAAPVVAVVLGALLLHERVPVGGLRVLVYLLCLVVIVGAAVWLATPRSGREVGADPAAATR